MEAVKEKIRNARGIVVFTGAGISTSCGIPDYRSKDGLFSRLSFDRAAIDTPEYQALVATMRAAQPSSTGTHHFCAWLHEQGKLIRVYTQNIDGLHQKAGLPPDKVVEVHGSITTPEDEVVFFGENISPKVEQQVKIDLIDRVEEVDLVIVMGTTLSVLPFAILPNMVRKECWRVFVNNDLTVLPTPQRKTKDGGGPLREGGQSFASYISICGRKVSVQPSWLDSRKRKPGIHVSKWKHQYLFESNCDEWCLSAREALS